MAFKRLRLLNNWEALRQILSLVTPYLCSEERWYARGMLAAIITLELVFVGLNVITSFWSNAFYSALQDLNYSYFLQLLGWFFILVLLTIIVFVCKFYLNQLLQIRWRTWMTHCFLGNYFANQSYYDLQVKYQGMDNPDQRISEDINTFTEQSLSLFLTVLSAVVTLASFVVVLWNLSGELTIPMWGNKTLTIPGYMVWAAVFYAGVGTWCIIKLGRPLIALDYQQERHEGNFRYALARMRDNVESVAFYKGESQEYSHLRNLFGAVVFNFKLIMLRMMRMNWFVNGYNNATTVFPVIVAAPRYFSGAIKLGDLMQISTAFSQVQGALSLIVNSFGLIANWLASARRLSDFADKMETSENKTNSLVIKLIDTPHLELKNMVVKRPDGKVLFTLLGKTFKRGKYTLVKGFSGIGKSTFLRTLAGIWPYAGGIVHKPSQQIFAFLPQKPYMTLGTLRHNICYPNSSEAYTDHDVMESMKRCELADFIGHLDETQDWGRVLSLGQQQRIAFVRILLQKPDWIFLDEATSSLDHETEALLYTVLKKQLPHATVVSVGHRSTLDRHHDDILDLNDHALV